LAEYALMTERFPQFLLTKDPSARLVWRGAIIPLEGGPIFIVRVVVPSDYPYSPPRLFVEQPRIRGSSPHLHPDGSLCVYKTAWDAARSTVASVIPLVSAWLVMYLAWMQTGETW
jgi:ubiquitin-protein ligase